MNKNAEKWLDALRSGEYEQTRSKLYNGENGYCCLGVACDLHAKETGGEWKTDNEWDSPAYMGTAMVLPYEVAMWLGLTTKAEDTGVIDDDTSLSGENDRGKSFEEIADLIEMSQATLFKGV